MNIVFNYLVPWLCLLAGLIATWMMGRRYIGIISAEQTHKLSQQQALQEAADLEQAATAAHTDTAAASHEKQQLQHYGSGNGAVWKTEPQPGSSDELIPASIASITKKNEGLGAAGGHASSLQREIHHGGEEHDSPQQHEVVSVGSTIPTAPDDGAAQHTVNFNHASYNN
jgi:hypothetical protein